MASVPLDLNSFSGGDLRRAAETAFQRVNDSFDDPDLDASAAREIKITIKFQKEGEAFVKTTHVVETKLPAKKVTGVAWQEDGALYTEDRCLGGDGKQTSYLDRDSRVVPIGRRNDKEE